MYWPYSKNVSKIMYIDKESNHLMAILQHIHILVQLQPMKRCLMKPKVLMESDHNSSLRYHRVKKNKNSSKKSCNKKVLWFYPPFSSAIKTNVAKMFLKLTSKHFAGNKLLNKLFNKNNVKVIYSCSDNMAVMVSCHSNKIVESNGNMVSNAVKIICFIHLPLLTYIQAT